MLQIRKEELIDNKWHFIVNMCQVLIVNIKSAKGYQNTKGVIFSYFFYYYFYIMKQSEELGNPFKEC